jgi:hypothetical protein
MTRPKRSSRVLQKAEEREASLESIDPVLNLGNDLTLNSYSALIARVRAQIANYNSTLSDLDDQARQIKESERQLRDLSEQMLLGVAAKYGKNSREYGKAGGVPKGEYRRSPRSKTAQSSSKSQPLVVTPINEKAAKSVNGNGNGKAIVS